MQRDGGPGGAGGAGNPTGSSFTGPAQALELVGDFAYSYTGNHAANTTAVEAMKFTTGNFYFVGIFQTNMALQNAATGSSSAVTFCQVELNGAVISHLAGGLTGSDALTSVRQPIIIPAYTEVVVKLYSNENEATRFMTATLTGRIYRG